MKPFWVFITILIIGIALTFGFLALNCSANTIGFSYDRAVDDSNFGIYGDYEQELDYLDFEAEGQMQGGDAYLGNLDLAFTFFNNFRVESNNTFKGFTLDSIGRKNNLGLSFVAPIGDTEVSVGVFGVNGNPFEPVYELDDPTNPESAVLKDSGLSIKEGSTLNAALKAEFDVSRFEVGIRGLIELAGEGDKVHQVDLDANTSGRITNSVNWTLQTRLSAQLYGDIIEYETRIISGIEYPF